jgi:hypothetical protein
LRLTLGAYNVILADTFPDNSISTLMYFRVYECIINWYKINYKQVTMSELNPICNILPAGTRSVVRRTSSASTPATSYCSLHAEHRSNNMLRGRKCDCEQSCIRIRNLAPIFESRSFRRDSRIQKSYKVTNRYETQCKRTLNS